MKDPNLLTQIRRNGLAAQEMLQGLFHVNVFDIIEKLQAAEVSNVTEITDSLDDVPQSQVSMSLRSLKRAKLVHRHRIGKNNFYNIIPGRIGTINRICAELADGYDASVTVLDQMECA